MRNIILLLATGSLLAACSAQKFQPGPEIALTANYKNRVDRRGETITPDTKWWANFDDDNLNSLIEQALAQNISIETARESIKAARANARISVDAYLPQIDATSSSTLSGTRDRQDVVTGIDSATGQQIATKRWATTNSSTVSKGLSGSWTLNPLAWKSTKEREQAKIAAEREALYAARLDIIASVASAYVNVQGAGRKIEIAKRSLAVQNQTTKITLSKMEAGSASTLDSARAKANAALTAADIPALQQSREQSLHQIASLLGKTPAELDSLYSRYKPLLLSRNRFSQGVPADLLRNRPDIRQQERLLAADVADIGVSEADLWPSLTLSGNIGASRTVNAGNAVSWSLGPSLSLPIFNRGALKASVDLSKSTARQRYLSYRQTVIDAAREVEDAVVALREEQLRYGRLSTAVAEYTTAERLARELNDAGTTEFNDVLDAQASLYSAQLELAGSQLQLALNYIALCQALGGGWAGEEKS